MQFLIEAKSLLSSPGKMIGEQYKIIGIAQAETIRHKRDSYTYIYIYIYTYVVKKAPFHDPVSSRYGGKDLLILMKTAGLVHSKLIVCLVQVFTLRAMFWDI